MGLSIFSSDKEYGYIDKAPNPNPSNFKICAAQELNNYVILLVKYPDCTNYEGLKILVYLFYSDTIDDKIEFLLRQTKLDPHFSKNQLSPVARFEPTKRGWELACLMADPNIIYGRIKMPGLLNE